MQSDLYSILTMLANGVPIPGITGVANRRTVRRLEVFDTLIEPSEIDGTTELPIPVPLSSAAPIDWGDTVLLLPEGPLKVYFENIRTAVSPGPFDPPHGGVSLLAGSKLLIEGADLRVSPGIAGVVMIENSGTEAVRLRGLVGGTTQSE